MKQFTKSDLKDGDQIIYSTNKIKCSGIFYCKGLGRFMNSWGGKPIDDYRENLTCKNDNRYDVKQVIRDGVVVFDRSEHIKDVQQKFKTENENKVDEPKELSGIKECVNWLIDNQGEELEIIHAEVDTFIGMRIMLGYSGQSKMLAPVYSDKRKALVNYKIFENCTFKPVPKVQYVDWSDARAWMEEKEGNVAMNGEQKYKINGLSSNYKYLFTKVEGVTIWTQISPTFELLDSKKWIILKDGE